MTKRKWKLVIWILAALWLLSAVVVAALFSGEQAGEWFVRMPDGWL